MLCSALQLLVCSSSFLLFCYSSDFLPLYHFTTLSTSYHTTPHTTLHTVLHTPNSKLQTLHSALQPRFTPHFTLSTLPQLVADEQTRNLRVANQVEVLNKERRRVARMCRGIGPTNFVEYSSTLELPSAAPKTAGDRDRVKSLVTEWSERDERFFESGWGLEVRVSPPHVS